MSHMIDATELASGGGQRRTDGVLKEHDGGNGLNSTGRGGDRGCDRAHRRQIHVTGKAARRGRAEAHVDYHSAGRNVVGADQARLPGCGHDYVRFPAYRGQVARPRVADGNGGVLSDQQQRDGFAHGNGTAHDNHPLPAQRDLLVMQDLHHGGGRGGREPGR
jgi:hypothetical protein